MKANEFIKSKEFAECVEKIKNYRKGFEFTIPFYKMIQPQKNAMNIVLKYCTDLGYIESIAIYLFIYGELTEEKYIRL